MIQDNQISGAKSTPIGGVQCAFSDHALSSLDATAIGAAAPCTTGLLLRSKETATSDEMLIRASFAQLVQTIGTRTMLNGDDIRLGARTRIEAK